jgi:CDP-6-deoxy-D-xylo-4-hexulose-3-dehydrase
MAAYGLVQMDKMDEFNRRRQHFSSLLDNAMARHDEKVTRPRFVEGVDATWMRYPFLLADHVDREAAQEHFAERDIPTRMIWTGNILRQPGFADIAHRQPAAGLPECDRVMNHALSLPTHHGLSSDDVGRMAQAIDDWRP